MKQQLEEHLNDHILMAELKSFHKGGCGTQRNHASLLAKARAYYRNSQHCELGGCGLTVGELISVPADTQAISMWS